MDRPSRAKIVFFPWGFTETQRGSLGKSPPDCPVLSLANCDTTGLLPPFVSLLDPEKLPSAGEIRFYSDFLFPRKRLIHA